MNENVSYDASEGANCKWKFSVWSTELFLYVVDLQVFKMADQNLQNLHNLAKLLNFAPISKQNIFL